MSCKLALCLAIVLVAVDANAANAANAASGTDRADSVNSAALKLEADCSYSPAGKRASRSLQKLDVYYNDVTNKTRPVVIFIHGGAFGSGDKKLDGAVLAPLFVEANCVYVSVNYRLSPAVRFPAHVEDVAAAISWIRSHIGSYGGDRNRLILLGHSAGAQLSALVTLDERYLRKHGLNKNVVSGVVLIDGGAYDVAASLLSKRERPVNSPTFSANPAVWQQASPLKYIADGRHVPPFLIFYLPTTFQAREQSVKMAKKLKSAGGMVELKEVSSRHKKHSNVVESLAAPGDIEAAMILAFIKRVAKGRQASPYN
jgi:arylformamidase